MSTNNFVKGECRHCAGHFEFPAEAASETITCPHCGQPTELVLSVPTNKTSGSRRLIFGLGLAMFIIATGLVVLYLRQSPGSAAIPKATAAPTNQPSLVVVPAAPADEERTNDFAISAIKLEKTPGSSLVYVTGKIRNLGDNRRFGVKVELNLFDANDNLVGKAKDYQPLLEPAAEWHFKALILDGNAVSARLSSIVEDQ